MPYRYFTYFGFPVSYSGPNGNFSLFSRFSVLWSRITESNRILKPYEGYDLTVCPIRTMVPNCIYIENCPNTTFSISKS